MFLNIPPKLPHLSPLRRKSPHKIVFLARYCRAWIMSWQTVLIRVQYGFEFPCQTQTRCEKFFSTTSLISSMLKQTNIHNDRRFLQTDSEENPEVRICTKGFHPHLQVLLCFHDIRVRSDGIHARSIDEEHGWRRRRKASFTTVVCSVTRNEWCGHRFRGFFIGRPGRYDLTRLFWFTSLTAGRRADS